MIPVTSRIHRILKSMPRFKNSEAPETKELILKLNLKDDIHGIYFNDQDVDPRYILIGETGLHCVNESTVREISYATIASTILPEKTGEKSLGIRFKNRSELNLIVSGVQHERFYDVFEFSRFVDRVVEDLRKNKTN